MEGIVLASARGSNKEQKKLWLFRNLFAMLGSQDKRNLGTRTTVTNAAITTSSCPLKSIHRYSTPLFKNMSTTNLLSINLILGSAPTEISCKKAIRNRKRKNCYVLTSPHHLHLLVLLHIHRHHQSVLPTHYHPFPQCQSIYITRHGIPLTSPLTQNQPPLYYATSCYLMLYATTTSSTITVCF